LLIFFCHSQALPTSKTRAKNRSLQRITANFDNTSLCSQRNKINKTVQINLDCYIILPILSLKAYLTKWYYKVLQRRRANMAKTTGQTKEEELATSKEAVMSAYNKLLEAKEHFRLAAEAAGVDMKQEATEQLQKGRAKGEELGKQASVFIQEKPLATLSVAFIAGYVLSQLFSRK
jgi:ElaB/YqjD/DUF883 family membrane-anchored ribosome-binding protein